MYGEEDLSSKPPPVFYKNCAQVRVQNPRVRANAKKSPRLVVGTRLREKVQVTPHVPPLRLDHTIKRRQVLVEPDSHGRDLRSLPESWAVLQEQNTQQHIESQAHRATALKVSPNPPRPLHPHNSRGRLVYPFRSNAQLTAVCAPPAVHSALSSQKTQKPAVDKNDRERDGR